MGFFDIFRRPPPVVTRGDLVDFIDAQAAFLTQKGIFEYSRARAGPYGNILFNDKGFLAALERSRWSAYPLALGMVAEAVEGTLRPAAGDRTALLSGVTAATFEAFDRFPVPPALSAEEWAGLRATLAHDLTVVGLHAVKHVKDIPVRFVDRYVAAMPIHEKLRAKDTLTIHNYLKANLCNAQDAFARRADLAALVKAVAAP